MEEKVEDRREATARWIEEILKAADFLGEWLRNNLEEISKMIAEAAEAETATDPEPKPHPERVTRDSTQRSRRFEIPAWYTSGFE
jgi:hypothetical protein